MPLKPPFTLLDTFAHSPARDHLEIIEKGFIHRLHAVHFARCVMDQITRVCGERSFVRPPFWSTAQQEIKFFRIVGMRWVVGIRLLNEETDLELVGTQLPLGTNQCDKRIPTFKHAWNVSLGLLPMGLISDFADAVAK